MNTAVVDGVVSIRSLHHSLILCFYLCQSNQVPADTIKQRLQLGYYTGMTNALVHMLNHEGLVGLYRALPVTLCTNLPYGAVMVTTNEALRGWLMASSSSESADGMAQPPSLSIQTTLIHYLFK